MAATATTSRLKHELLQMAERIELRAAKEDTEDETSCRDNCSRPCSHLHRGELPLRLY